MLNDAFDLWPYPDSSSLQAKGKRSDPSNLFSVELHTIRMVS